MKTKPPNNPKNENGLVQLISVGSFILFEWVNIIEPVHEITNNVVHVVCATSKAPDQPAHTRSLIRAFASRLSIL